jgi:hypothetical protein
MLPVIIAVLLIIGPGVGSWYIFWSSGQPNLTGSNLLTNDVKDLVNSTNTAGLDQQLTQLTRSSDVTPQPKRGLVDDGEYVSKDKEPFSEVRDYLKNGAANSYAFAITEGGMRHTVLNVGIRELVSVNSAGKTTYIQNSIQNRIKNAVAWNKKHPDKKLTVHLRFHVGNSAPQAWKDICGTVDMTDPNFNVKAIAPRWWVKKSDGSYPYRTLYSDAMKELAKAVTAINASGDTKNIIGSVNIPGAAPNYPEPMIIYANSAEVRKNLRSAGFTADEHNNFMMWLPSTASLFDNVAIELALNPYQNINDKGESSDSDSLKYRDMAAALISKVGSRTVLANYSARYMYMKPEAKNNYIDMYDWMAEKVKGSPRVWAGVQMARPQRVAIDSSSDPEQWDNVAMWAAGKGFHFAETTGPGSGDGARMFPGSANVWPGSYNDDPNDIASIRMITSRFLANPRPM